MLNSLVLLHVEQGNHEEIQWVYRAMFVSVPVQNRIC